MTTDYEQRAEKCRRLAELARRAEDWGHFLEMAQTWELLAALRQDKLDRTLALAESIAKDMAAPTKN
jgi:hypothetical protein